MRCSVQLSITGVSEEDGQAVLNILGKQFHYSDAAFLYDYKGVIQVVPSSSVTTDVNVEGLETLHQPADSLVRKIMRQIHDELGEKSLGVRVQVRLAPAHPLPGLAAAVIG